MIHDQCPLPVYFSQVFPDLAQNYLAFGLIVIFPGLVAEPGIPSLTMKTYFLSTGLVDCYMASHRTREAITYAAHAYKQLGTNARSLTVSNSD